MSPYDKSTLMRLLYYCDLQVTKQQKLLNKWRDQPQVAVQTIEKTMEVMERWRSQRDALLRVLGT